MAKTARRRAPVSNRARARQAAQDATPSPTSDDSGTSGTSLGAGLAPAGRRRNPFGFLKKLQPRFIADIVSELRKVTWPSLAETRYLTIVVAIVAIIIGMFLGALDLVFGWVIEQLFF